MQTSNRPSLLELSFLGLLLLLAVLTAWQWRDGSPISANLLHILPVTQADPLLERAQQQTQTQLDQELILLVQHPEARTLLPEWLHRLQESKQFARIDYRVDVNLQQLGQQLLDGRATYVPLAVRQQIAEEPRQFFTERLQEIFDPIAGFSWVGLQQDWLGLTGKIQQHLQGKTAVQADAQGFLLIETDALPWYVVRLQSHAGGFAGNTLAVAESMRALKQQIQQQNGRILASGGVLFAALAQEQAEQEIKWLGGISLVGSLVLVLWLFRRINSLLIALPALIGLWAGATLCIAVFGQIHVLTLVLGVSLMGVAIDFPMHYLSKAWVIQPWDARRVLRLTLPGLTLGVLSNAVGYTALAFTPFPALSQVAVFSVAGLIAAYWCTIACLPRFLSYPQAVQPWRQPLFWMQRLLMWHKALFSRVNRWLLLAVVLAFTLLGFNRLELHDDLRQWISPAPELLRQAQQIGELTGQQPTSQFFLVQAATEAELFARLTALEDQLDKQIMAGALTGYQSITDLLAGMQGTPSLEQALTAVDLQAIEPLVAAGIDAELVQQEIQLLMQQKTLTIDEALATDLGEAWRLLWLGQNAQEVASVVRLQGLHDVAPLSELTEQLDGVRWIDRPAQLNRLFEQTQRYALWTKLLASVTIFVLLTLFLGWRGAARTLGISLLAALLAAATLGWLGWPVTLFSIFGLLLVTAIGVDYAILMYEEVGGRATSLLGAFMAALTTWLSFGLLALSSTPAVSSFGVAVSLGLMFNFLLAPWACRAQNDA